MNYSDDEKTWLVAIINDKVKHLDSSPHTKEALDKMEKRLDHMEAEIQNKVNTKMFIWIVGILIGIWLSVSGYIASQIHDLQARTFEMSSSVSEITGVLKNAQFN